MGEKIRYNHSVYKSTSATACNICVTWDRAPISGRSVYSQTANLAVPNQDLMRGGYSTPFLLLSPPFQPRPYYSHPTPLPSHPYPLSFQPL
jgi:hypothetical protein